MSKAVGPILTMLSIGVEKLYKLTLGLIALEVSGGLDERTGADHSDSVREQVPGRGHLRDEREPLLSIQVHDGHALRLTIRLDMTVVRDRMHRARPRVSS